MSMETYYENYLKHHGIRGQKWGKKNGPPYPLKPGDHSASEKKSGWKNSLDSKDTNKDNKGEFNLTDKQKKALIVAGIATVAVVGGVALYKSGAINPQILSTITKGKTFSSNSDILGTTVDTTPAKDIVKYDPNFKLNAKNAVECSKGVNPTHSTTNCGSTSTATLANAMGGDYQSLPEVPEHMRKILKDGTLGKGYDPEKLIACYDGGKWTNLDPEPKTIVNLRNSLRSNLESQPDGAKGIMYFDKVRGYESGHYYTWAKIDGKLHILEGQSNNATGIDWTGDQITNNVINKLSIGENAENTAHIARLDNCPILPGREKDLFMPRERIIVN